MDRAISDIEDKVNKFLSTAPKTYKDLANAISGSLIWTAYEDCHVDEFILKILVENFLKINKK